MTIKITAFIIAFIIVALLITFPVMWLWNWLMPVIFSLPVINFWQALGIWVLSSLLFRSTNIK